jgi:hypothetical protein
MEQSKLNYIRGWKKRSRAKARQEAYTAYGGPICACCGETELMFLTIDHIDGGGCKEDRKVRRHLPVSLKSKGFPQGYQVLCFNCNCGRARNEGVCPHQAKNLVSLPA